MKIADKTGFVALDHVSNVNTMMLRALRRIPNEITNGMFFPVNG